MIDRVELAGFEHILMLSVDSNIQERLLLRTLHRRHSSKLILH